MVDVRKKSNPLVLTLKLKTMATPALAVTDHLDNTPVFVVAKPTLRALDFNAQNVSITEPSMSIKIALAIQIQQERAPEGHPRLDRAIRDLLGEGLPSDFSELFNSASTTTFSTPRLDGDTFLKIYGKLEKLLAEDKVMQGATIMLLKDRRAGITTSFCDTLI